VNDSPEGKTGVVGWALALLIAVCLLGPIHAGRPKMLHADEQSNGRTLKLAAGELLEIVLGENPTTGYRWRFAETGAPTCTLVSDAYEPSGEGVPGQGGVHRWKIQAAEAGTCRIELVYQRPWDQNAHPRRTFRLQVEVRNGVQEKTPAKPIG